MSARPSEDAFPLLLGWLRRARAVPEAGGLALRGSLALNAWCGGGRAAADVDYLVPGPFDPAALSALAARVAAEPDAGTELRLARTEVIWGDTPFPGLRAFVEGRATGGADAAFQVDFACGDPLTLAPAPLEVRGAGEVRACRPETLWAWKLHGLVEFGPGKWRAKDLYDLHLLGSRAALDEGALPEAVEVAFRSRGMDPAELHDFRTRDAWGCSGTNRRKWKAFGRRYGVDADFLTVRDAVRGRVERVLG